MEDGIRHDTQIQSVETHLKTYGDITPKVAWLSYGCYRLSSVIHRLRHDKQLSIRTKIENENGTSYARYILDTAS